VMLSLGLLYLTGLGMIIQYASTNTLIQTIVDDSKRGRVMALYGMSFLGVTPVGSLLLGSIAGAIGVQITLFASSVVCLVAAGLYSRRIGKVKQSLEVEN